MAGPITWKNIDVVSPQREAYNPMIAAQLGMTAGFDKLGQVYDQYQNQRKADNTSAFEMALAQYKTPEEMRAAIASGAIDNLRAQYGVQMDQKVANTGADTRLTNLMTQTKAGQEFDDNQKDRLDDPIVQEIKARVARGDIVGARALQEQSQLRKPGDVAQSITVGDQALKKFNDERRAAEDTHNTSAETLVSTQLGNADKRRTGAIANAKQPGLLASASEASRLAEAGIKASRVMASGVAEINRKLEAKEITPIQASDEYHKYRQEAMSFGISGEQLAQLDKDYNPGADYSPSSQARLREQASASAAVSRKVGLEWAKNPYLRSSYNGDPNKTADDLLKHAAFVFTPTPGETPEQAAKREEIKKGTIAEMQSLVGQTRTYKDKKTGKDISVTITPEDLKQALNYYLEQNGKWFSEGSTTNLDPTKLIFWKDNFLDKHLKSDVRIRHQRAMEEIQSNPTSQQEAALYNLVSGGK